MENAWVRNCLNQFFGGFLKALDNAVSTLTNRLKRHFQCVRLRKIDPRFLAYSFPIYMSYAPFSLRLMAHIQVKRALLYLLAHIVLAISVIKLFDFRNLLLPKFNS